MEKIKRIQKLEEAADLIGNAIDLISDALQGTSEESHAAAYIIPHLENWIGNGNPYDKDIFQYIESLQEEEEFEED